MSIEQRGLFSGHFLFFSIEKIFFQPDSFCQVGILECCHGAMREPKKIKNIFFNGTLGVPLEDYNILVKFQKCKNIFSNMALGALFRC